MFLKAAAGLGLVFLGGVVVVFVGEEEEGALAVVAVLASGDDLGGAGIELDLHAGDASVVDVLLHFALYEPQHFLPECFIASVAVSATKPKWKRELHLRSSSALLR